jgi:hypothetical protein
MSLGCDRSCALEAGEVAEGESRRDGSSQERMARGQPSSMNGTAAASTSSEVRPFRPGGEMGLPRF